MSGDTRRPWLARSDRKAAAGVFAIALAAHVATALLGVSSAKISLSSLGVYFDGNLYLEIARSFPLPYSPQGPDYLGQAPLYPALIHVLRLLTPDAPFDWGLLALLASWLPAALAAVAFFALCRELGMDPFWPSVAFALANPRWMTIAASPHPESLAMLFTLLALNASLRGALPASMIALSLAGLARFPSLLIGAPIAFGALYVRRSFDLRTLATLALPVLAFGLFNLYLALRVPGFGGVMATHQVFWVTAWTWPFASLVENALPWWRSGNGLYFAITYTTLAFYLATCVLGLRSLPREQWVLPLTIAVIVLFHACLSGAPATWDFTRLAILAWPAALLIFWKVALSHVPVAAVAALCAGLGIYALAVGQRSIREAVELQDQLLPYLPRAIERLDEDEPRWIHFGVAPGSPRIPDGASDGLGPQT